MAAKKLFFLAVKEMSLSIVLRRNEVREGYVAEEVAASTRRMRALQPVSNPYCLPHFPCKIICCTSFPLPVVNEYALCGGWFF